MARTIRFFRRSYKDTDKERSYTWKIGVHVQPLVFVSFPAAQGSCLP